MQTLSANICDTVCGGFFAEEGYRIGDMGGGDVAEAGFWRWLGADVAYEALGAVAGAVASACRQGQLTPIGPGCFINTNPLSASAVNGSDSMSDSYSGSGAGGF